MIKIHFYIHVRRKIRFKQNQKLQHVFKGGKTPTSCKKHKSGNVRISNKIFHLRESNQTCFKSGFEYVISFHAAMDEVAEKMLQSNFLSLAPTKTQFAFVNKTLSNTFQTMRSLSKSTKIENF